MAFKKIKKINGAYFGNKTVPYYNNELDYIEKEIKYSFESLSKSEKLISRTMRGIFEGKLVKRDGKMIYKQGKNRELYKKFVEELKEGQTINVYMEATSGNGTLAQLAKVHKCIRVLANDIGYSFEDVKFLVKDKAGLVIKRNVGENTYNDWKSFADCSVEELNLAIQACIDLGDFVGSNLR